MHNTKILKFLLFVLVNGLSTQGYSKAYEESLSRQISQTQSKTFKNGITFVQRELPGSEIAHLEINFRSGQANLSEAQRALNGITFDVMAMSTKKYTKERIFGITEKFSVGLQCSGGIEQSGCQFETISDHFEEGYNLLASVVLEPNFNDEDLILSKKRRTAQFLQEQQNPEQHVNSLINKIFYQANHPYRHLPADAIAQLEKFTQNDLKNYHKSLLNAESIQIVYVGPKLTDSRYKKIQKDFSTLRGSKISKLEIPSPLYNPKENFVFEHRTIPTAYIRAKFNAPGITSQESATSKVLFEILGEVLHEEVRTKRSLSYSIGAMSIQLNQGIGVIAASTSKPKETIETISTVLKGIIDLPLSESKLAEYKNVFTTSHYLTLETNNSFASALSSSLQYFGDANQLYYFPEKITAVTPKAVQELAKKILKQFRVGVIYDQDKFKSEWVEPLTRM